MNIDFLNIEEETAEEFKAIAIKLLNNYAIQTHDSLFRLTEIEFYWTSPKHKDDSTYLRKYVDPKHGEWFFHYSGVDIALENEKLGGFGGILIRSIYNITENKLYKGPMVCAMKLFSGTSAFFNSIKTKIISYDFNQKEISESSRIGLGNNAINSGTDRLNYRFTIKI
ncbi:hypothetical protein [Pedobacter alpinus]|uniref:Uncharacterized protein n=1 Tax=Pedobacter alpinus TaxID=1590643 RepID=A0ABW5TTS1_9SPHI